MNDLTTHWVAPAVLALLVVIGAVRSTQNLTVIIVAGLTVVVAGAVMRSTGWLLLVPAAVAALGVAVLCSGRTSNIGWFAICVLVGWCTLQAGTGVAVVATAGAISLFLFEWVTVCSDLGWTTWIVGTGFTTVVCLLARRQYQLLGELRLAQAGLAAQARAEERLRISRELHDLIGHSLTVSLLHVTSARLAVEEDPGSAIAALAEAERLGRQSLTEVRQAVGLLRERADDPAPSLAGPRTEPLAPTPGVDQLPALIDGFRRAGVRVSSQFPGDVLTDQTGFTATTGLTIYRILQEALTNAARHAPGADTVVRMDVDPARTMLTIDSTGTPKAGYAQGFGLVSMRERAEALGGTLTAGPSSDGWRVQATLPGATSVPGEPARSRRG